MSAQEEVIDEDAERKEKRKQIGGVNKEDANDGVIVFKRMTDIHTLNLKYFKAKPGEKDVRVEDANDMHTKITKNEYI